MTHERLSNGVHAVSGDVVGTTDTQTLTNKTLTSVTLTTPTLTLKQSATPTPTAEGDIQWDTDDNRIAVGDGAGTKVFSDDSATVVHGATGAVVGTTNTQTLTNKTIDGGSNTLSGIAASSITNTAATLTDTQTLTNKTMSGSSNTFTNIAASAIKADAWTSYTPTWTASTVNPAIGNGTLTGYYIQYGKTVHFNILVTMGSTTTYGTGYWRFLLPSTPVSTRQQTFSSMINDSSAGNWYPATGIIIPADSLTSFTLWTYNAASAASASGILTQQNYPVTFATSDTVAISGTYEAA